MTADAITLDQLRVLVTVAEAGSFSAAARRLRRAQSSVSHAVASLEAQLGLALWDRATRVPTLTPQGTAVLAAARKVCGDADALRSLAEGLVGGLEPAASLCVDAIFPTTALVALCREFAKAFPTVPLRVHTETMRAVGARVLDGTCLLGVAGPTASDPGLERRPLASVQLVPVAAPSHPLASVRGRVSSARLSAETQIVLSERGDERAPDQGVLSLRTWRVVDMTTRHALIRAGLGWGNLPEHLARRDLEKGRLVRLRPAAWADDEHRLNLSLVHRPDLAAGPATRWIIERLAALCLEHLGTARS